MKKLFTLLTAVAVAGSVMAQNEQIHIFRNDKNFSTHKGSDVKSITFEGATGAYKTMIITPFDGSTVSYPMSVVDSIWFTETGIPEIYVDLQDYPKWTELQGSKEDIHPATLKMLGNGMFDDLAEQTVEFRGRGNSTWKMRKKPYRFKMAKKAAVCKLPKAKTFALIANNIDCTLMRNTIALWFANYLGMPYSNHCVPVKVIFNGINKGQYMLTEKIGIGGGSVDIDETTGMLFELDSNYDEDFKFKYTFKSGYATKTIPVMVKDPDLAELAADETVTTITDANAYFELWKADFIKMADAVTSRSSSQSLKDVLDLDAAVNFFLVNGLAANTEMKHPKSLYIHKKSLNEGEVYSFGPVWDFDWSFTYGGDEGNPYDRLMCNGDGDYAGGTFLRCIFRNEEFRALYKQKLDDFYENGYPQLKEFIEEYAKTIEPSAKENGVLWPSYTHASWCKVTSSFEFRNNLEILKKWIDDRINFMRSNANYGLY